MKRLTSKLKFLLIIYLLIGTSNHLFSAVTDSSSGGSNADLWHSDFMLSTNIISSGESLLLLSSQHNSGTGTSGSYSTAYYLSQDSILNPAIDSSASGDILLGTTNVYQAPGNIVFGDSLYLFSFPNFAVGNYYIICQTDYTDSVEEYDETNNLALIPITVSSPFVDLFPSNPMIPDSVSVGYNALLSYNVNNTGSSTARNYSDAYYISNDTIFDSSDMFVGSVQLYSSPGTTYPMNYYFTIPNLPLGQYYLFYFSDNSSLITETNEDNNKIYKPFRVVSPSIDLAPKGLELTVQAIAPGNNITIMYSEQNFGTIAAGLHSVNLYLSQDSIIDNSDILLNQQPWQNIEPFRLYTNAFYVNIPNSISPGTYYFIESVDANNEVSETNEDNNIAILRAEIVSPNVDLTVVPNDPLITTFVGQYLYASFNELNLGSTQAGWHSIKFYLSTDTIPDGSDLYISENFTPMIPGQGSYTTGFGFYLPPSITVGNYYLIGVADENNVIEETNESNNISFSKVVITTPTYDIAVNDLETSNTNLYKGIWATASCKVSNLGIAPIEFSTVDFYLSKDTILSYEDTNLNSNYVQWLYPNQQSDFSIWLPIPTDIDTGVYYLICAADLNNNIDELNENNNKVYLPIVVKNIDIDLSIKNPNVIDSKFGLGTYNPVNYSLVNKGGTHLSYNNYINTGYYLSQDTIYDYNDLVVGGNYFQGLGDNDSLNIDEYLYIPTYLTTGDYYLLFVADNINNVTETNENNNVSYIKIKVVQPNVDLRVKYATLEHNTIYKDTPVAISNYLINRGNDLSYYSYTGYVLSTDTLFNLYEDVLLSQYLTYSLNGKDSIYQSTNISIPGYLNAGDYYLLFVADIYNNQVEKNESNNIVVRKIKVRDNFVDLDIKAPTISKQNLIPGESFVAKQTISNKGNLYTYYNFTGYYLSKDKAFSYDDFYLNATPVYYLNGNSEITDSVTLTIPSNIISGKYYLIYFADAYNYTYESNENNNFAFSAIKISSPNQLKESAVEEELPSAILDATIAPNPVGESINILLSGYEIDKEVTFTLLDLMGNRIHVSTCLVPNRKYSIPSGQLSSGVYLLQIDCNGKIKTVRVLKQ